MDIQKIDKKIPGGKLLRVEFAKDKDRVTYIKITGDFFIYPEKSIEQIEKIILENNLIKLEDKLNEHIVKNKIQIIGFTISDLINIIK